jgi:hypothetical protein
LWYFPIDSEELMYNDHGPRDRFVASPKAGPFTRAVARWCSSSPKASWESLPWKIVLPGWVFCALFVGIGLGIAGLGYLTGVSALLAKATSPAMTASLFAVCAILLAVVGVWSLKHLVRRRLASALKTRQIILVFGLLYGIWESQLTVNSCRRAHYGEAVVWLETAAFISLDEIMSEWQETIRQARVHEIRAKESGERDHQRVMRLQQLAGLFVSHLRTTRPRNELHLFGP